MRRLFLSYHSPDQALAERLKAAIERKDADTRVFFAPASLRAGSFWSKELAEGIAQADAFVLLVGEQGIGGWQEIEYYEAFDKGVKLPGFSLILVLLEGQTAPGLSFLRTLHWIVTSDPSSEKDVARLFDAIAGANTRPGELWRYTSPYHGLAAMEEKDSDYFFGRGRETIDVLSALADTAQRIPILLGNSGVGKSSLAQAGVLASLKRQAWPDVADAPRDWPHAFRDSRRWCFLTFKPGTEPLKALVETFFDTWQLGATEPKRVEQQKDWIRLLYDGKATLRDLLDATERRYKELNRAPPTAFLLYVDQGEELYVRSEEHQRRRFSELIAQGVADPRVYALMSMRTDFLGELQKDELLYKVRRQIDVPPLREKELREVVGRPAELLSARFETNGLVDIITQRTAEDSIKDVGALPLLSYTLDDMWTQMVKRGDGVLRLPAQTFELGGVLVARADEFLRSHPKFENELRRIFTRKLANVRDGEEPTRRRALRSEFTNDEWRLVCELVDHPNRLLVTATPEGGETYAEVAHEAIFRRWSRVRDWIVAEHEFLAWKTGLEAARRAWQATPDSSKSDAQLRGVPLAQAQNWLEKHFDDIPTSDRSFIDASTKQANEETGRTRRTRRVMGALGTALALVLFVIGAEGYFTWRNGQPWGSLTDLFNGDVSELRGDAISIGRSAGAIKNMLNVPDAYHAVSRLQLFVSRDGVSLDARSLNGTTINARYLQYGYERKLEDGDIVALAGTAAYQFHTAKPPLLPNPWREKPKGLPPDSGTWALLIDGKHRQIIALTRERYFVSADANGAVNLSDQMAEKSLLYINMPTKDHRDIYVANLARGQFLTAMVKSEDRLYSSLKMDGPHDEKQLQSMNVALRERSKGGEYISKVTFCFKQAEQSVFAVAMNPSDDLGCHVGPLQIIIRTR